MSQHLSSIRPEDEVSTEIAGLAKATQSWDIEGWAGIVCTVAGVIVPLSTEVPGHVITAGTVPVKY